MTFFIASFTNQIHDLLCVTRTVAAFVQFYRSKNDTFCHHCGDSTRVSMAILAPVSLIIHSGSSHLGSRWLKNLFFRALVVHVPAFFVVVLTAPPMNEPRSGFCCV